METVIYVALLNEGTDVWRPVVAVRLEGSRYRIVEQTYDRVTERWEFEPGDEVYCEPTQLAGGATLTATKRA